MEISIWNQLDEVTRVAILSRAPQNRSAETQRVVTDIIEQVRDRGDEAVHDLTALLDHVTADVLEVDEIQRANAAKRLDPDVRQSIDVAYANIHSFHSACQPENRSVETVPGVVCQARYVGIERVGLYAPGGATPLPSSVLMMGIPAQLADCREVVLCTSPRSDGEIDPAIAYAADRCGIHRVFRIGGAQAIAAMAMGTESVPKCDKVFGPGSVWVTEAKRQLAAGDFSVTIDMPAGPSEVLVIADKDADEVFVAADLVAQIEHGCDSQAILVTDSMEFATRVITSVNQLSVSLDRQELIAASLQHSHVLIAEDMVQAVEIANRYAAEHLIIQTRNAESLSHEVNAAGSVFLGAWTPEVLGDYCSGTNHVLPTCGFARSVNGLSVADFMKRITVQHATPEGLTSLAATAVTLARWEGLTAHALAIAVREEAIKRRASDVD